MITLFLRFELQKIVRYFRTTTLAKVITASLFIGVFLCVGVGLYFFFLAGFRFVNFSIEPEIQQPLTLFIYELFLLVLSGVIVFSALISGIFSLFRDQYDGWLISSPGYKLLPRFVLVKSLLSSSWPLFVIFLPAVLAFTKIYHMSSLGIFFIIVSVLLLLIILNTLSLLVILFISYSYHNLSKSVASLRFSFGGLITSISLIVIMVLLIIWRTIAEIDLVKLFKADNVNINVSIQNISSHFTALPTHPLALQILNWQNNNTSTALSYFFFLATLTALMVALWWKLSPSYYPLWQKFQEGSSLSAKSEPGAVKTRTPYYFYGSSSMALFKKEVLSFSRNLRGVMWFLFLFSLWLAQLGTNIILHRNISTYQTDVSEKLAVFQAIQFIIAIYFICSFALRFVFPSFSVEKKTMWIVGSAPLSFTKMFFSKYLFYTTFFIALGGMMSYVNTRILNLAFTYTTYSMSLFIVTVVFIITLALSLGALFPSTETDDPEAISTSMPGLFFTALSLIYGALSAGVLYVTIIKGITTPLVVFILVTLVCIGTLLQKVPSVVNAKVYT